MINRRKALTFDNMKCRTFMHEDTVIAIFQPKNSEIDGFIQWTISMDSSQIKLFATPKVAKEQNKNVPVSYSCDFDHVITDRMVYNYPLTWEQCEVSRSDFENDIIVRTFVRKKSLSYMFDRVMVQMFGRMNYNRPLTDPLVHFKPLKQRRAKYWKTKAGLSIGFALPYRCAAIWNLECENIHEILFVPNRFQLANPFNGNINASIGKFYNNHEEITRNAFHSGLMAEDFLIRGCNSRLAVSKKLSLIYQEQAELWFNLVTTTDY